LQPSSGQTHRKETLVGSVERVNLHNEDNGFAVLKVIVVNARTKLKEWLSRTSA
jgi:hypothetical protein